MNEERDVNQEQQTEEVVEEQQPSGLMAQEKQNMESEEANEEGINTHQDENIGAEEEGKAKSTKDQTGFQKSSGMKKMVQILKTWLKALIPWRKS